MHPQISPNQTKLQQTPTTQQQTPKKGEKGKRSLMFLCHEGKIGTQKKAGLLQMNDVK
jgi:hypothetical protein